MLERMDDRALDKTLFVPSFIRQSAAHKKVPFSKMNTHYSESVTGVTEE